MGFRFFICGIFHFFEILYLENFGPGVKTSSNDKKMSNLALPGAFSLKTPLFSQRNFGGFQVFHFCHFSNFARKNLQNHGSGIFGVQNNSVFLLFFFVFPKMLDFCIWVEKNWHKIGILEFFLAKPMRFEYYFLLCFFFGQKILQKKTNLENQFLH